MTWDDLQRLTAARIGLARAGPALATRPLLEFRLAQARARDAVHTQLDEPALRAALPTPAVTVHSRATDRQTYLRRPDLGRALADPAPRAAPSDLVIVLADGLSPAATQRHAPPLLELLLPELEDWSLAPLVIAHHARVALGDRVAEALDAASVLILIGERPGLSAPDSLGAYLTWAPGPTTTDADRNCVSNIRPDGLPYAAAARTLLYLLTHMRRLATTGLALKDASDRPTLPT